MTKKRRSPSRRNPQRSGLLWMATLVTALLLIAGIVYGLQFAAQPGSVPSASATAVSDEPGNDDLAGVPRIGPEEASALLARGEAVLYDTRAVESYATKHAVGAISLPPDEVEARLTLLPRDKTLIFY